MAVIQIPYAIKDGRLVHVDSVARGAECGCICPNCGKPVQAKQGRIRVHHFSQIGKIDCSSALALQKVAILLLMDRLQKGLVEGREVPFSWNCECCHETHCGNLLRRGAAISLSETGDFDIVIQDKDNKIIGGIKITARKSGKDPGAVNADMGFPPGIRMRINISDDKELPKITASPILFDSVDFCREQVTNFSCPQCSGKTYRKAISAIDIDCWKCGTPMKLAAIKSCGQWHGAEVFSQNDILAANQLGVIVQNRRSKTVGEKYQACCCPLCGFFFGQFYFHEHVAIFSETSPHRIEGSFCPECEKSFDVEQND